MIISMTSRQLSESLAKRSWGKFLHCYDPRYSKQAGSKCPPWLSLWIYGDCAGEDGDDGGGDAGGGDDDDGVGDDNGTDDTWQLQAMAPPESRSHFTKRNSCYFYLGM